MTKKKQIKAYFLIKVWNKCLIQVEITNRVAN